MYRLLCTGCIVYRLYCVQVVYRLLYTSCCAQVVVHRLLCTGVYVQVFMCRFLCTGSCVRRRKLKRVSLNETPEVSFWCLYISVDFNFRNQKTIKCKETTRNNIS